MVLIKKILLKHEKNGNKFTCRYEIQIENEKEFVTLVIKIKNCRRGHTAMAKPL